MAITIKFPKSRPDLTLYAYCDESSQTNHRYFCIGAIYFIPAVPSKGPELCQQLESALLAERSKYGLESSKLKWEKIPSPGQYLDGYKNEINFYLDNAGIGFRCMVVDTYRYSLDDKNFMKKDPELGYMKFFCVFIADGLMKAKEDYFFEIKVDRRITRPQYSIEELEDATNCRFIKHSKAKTKICMQHCKIEELESKKSCFLQIADILTGAVAAKWNGRVKAVGKLEMIDYIEKKMGKDLLTPTPAWGDRFNIWAFKA